MDRSLYPDGVEVRRLDLENTEDTRAFHILQRSIDTSTTGVVEGLVVLPNGTLVNITSGHGYSQNGELIEVPSSINDVELADYTAGAKNYIIFFYSETKDGLRPHETSGDSLPTKAVRSYRLVVMTEAQADLLPETTENIDGDSKDKALVVGIVTAQGSGVNLTSANVEVSTAFGGGTTATLSGLLTGVEIIKISDDTPSGTGVLNFTVSSGELEWIAPGNDTSGVPQDVSSGGVFTLTSQPSGVTITVQVSDALLPASNVSSNVVVTNIYRQTILKNSALDIQHRSFIGSGIPKPNNPHGLTAGDLGLGETQTEFHQQALHSNGITSESNPNFLKPTVNTGFVPHRIDVVGAGVGDSVYIGGFSHNQTNGTSVSFSDVVDDAQILFDVFAVVGTGNGVTSFSKTERMRYDTIPPPSLASVCQLRDMSDDHPDGTGFINYNDTLDTLAYQAPGDGFGTPVPIQTAWQRETQRLYSSDKNNWIDVFVRGLVYWSSISGTIETVTIAPSLTPAELTDRYLICRIMFSGSGTGFLGGGFDSFINSPNDPNDKRRIGNTGYDRIGSDVGQIGVRTRRGVSVNQSYNYSEYPIQIKEQSALQDGPYGEAGALTVYNGGLWFWTGSNWVSVA